MGRPRSDLDEYLDWQERLESYRASGLEIDVFCLKEGVSRSTFYRWKKQLEDGIPESMVAEKATRDRAESAEGASFVPISLKASPVEIELPNGGVISPVLSNIVLHEVDRQWCTQDGQASTSVRLVRYADDMVLLAKTADAANAAWARLQQQFATLRLVVNQQKSRLTTLDDGFAFLGFEFHRQVSGSLRNLLWPSGRSQYRDRQYPPTEAQERLSWA